MAAGLGFNPGSFSPMTWLQQRIVNSQGQPATAPPTPSAPQGAEPPVSAPTEAPPPAATAATSPGASGSGGGFGGIGSAISRMMSGEGLFGGGQPEGEADPVTGMTPGMQRRAGAQSMMKIGLLLMAAGTRQSDESRARILSALPGAIGDGNDVNNFARNRLEMAKIKLLERQNAAASASDAAVLEAIRGGSAPAADGVNSPVAPPATATPGAAITTGGPSGAETTVAPVSGATMPGTGPEPSTGAPSPSTSAPTPSQVITYSDVRPPAPPIPKFKALETDKAAISAAMASGPGGLSKWYTERQEKLNNQRLTTNPYRLKDSDQIVQDVYQNGRFIGTEPVGKIPERAEIVQNPDGSRTVNTFTGNNQLSGSKTERDPVMDKARNDERDVVIKDRGELRNDGREVANSLRTYDRMRDLEKKVMDDKTITGPGASVRRAAASALVSAGLITDRGMVEKLQNTQMTEQELGVAAAEFAKANMGPQVSNQDIEVAMRMFGAVMSNDKYQIANSLRQVRSRIREKATGFQTRAREHNEMTDRLGMKSEVYRVKNIDRDFSQEKDSDPELLPPQPQEAAPGVVEFDPVDPTPAIDAGRNAVKAGAPKAAIYQRLKAAGVPEDKLTEFK